MTTVAHRRGLKAETILWPMSTMRLSGRKQGSPEKHAADERRAAVVLARITKGQPAAPRVRADLADRSVRERYLAWLRGGVDHRSYPFGPFGPETA